VSLQQGRVPGYGFALFSTGERMTPQQIRALSALDVHRVLSQHILVDGYSIVLDLEASLGSRLVDAISGEAFLDFYSFFSSSPLGLNPPDLTCDDEFMRRLAVAAVNKPANSDMYTIEFAKFVATFARVLGDPALPHLFFIDGGALAVENTLKAAFDWKAKRLGKSDLEADRLCVLHLENAFHGRSGYTLSLTNTDPVKTALFPKFPWPRIPAPTNRAEFDHSLDLAREAFERADGNIACFIAEPIQCEGGDNHLSAEFLLAMQDMTVDYDALFVVDEVQTGCATGAAWAYQALGLRPDLVAFGKKTQVCGVMGGRRIDDVADNVFVKSSRINATWGGSLVDMVRARYIFEIIEANDLFKESKVRGMQLVSGLKELTDSFPRTLSNPRGSGVLCAVDICDSNVRDQIVSRLLNDHHILVLSAREKTIRFRPPLTISASEVDMLISALQQVFILMRYD
jgi:L-lysine 6-transaminase